MTYFKNKFYLHVNSSCFFPLPVKAVNILVIYSKIDILSAIKKPDQFAVANLEIHTGNSRHSQSFFPLPPFPLSPSDDKCVDVVALPLPPKFPGVERTSVMFDCAIQ